jgi:polar amino acid transport system permease protein
MNIGAAQPPGLSKTDPTLFMGKQLAAEERKIRLVHTIEVSLVWLALVIIVTFILLNLNFDPAYVAHHYTFVLQGAGITLMVSMVSIAFASILALIAALGRLSNNPIAQGVCGFYISVIRGTPLLIQIYLIYLGLPQIGRQLQVLGFTQLGQMLTLTALQSGILALSLNYGAYMAEIFRAGIQSISHGQREAAIAIGMNRWQMMRRVILPQAIRVIIPDIGNQFIAMQKDSAQVSVMGIWEITYRANRLARQESKFMEMFLLAALVYWIITIISTWFQERLERKLAHAYER